MPMYLINALDEFVISKYVLKACCDEPRGSLAQQNNPLGKTSDIAKIDVRYQNFKAIKATMPSRYSTYHVHR